LSFGLSKGARTGEFRDFVRGQRKGRRGKIDPGVGSHLGSAQGGRGQIGIAAGEVEEGEWFVALEQFVMEDLADFTVEERVVINAKTVNVPLREEGVDSFRHGGRRGHRVAGRLGRATTR
jgi:hypothetical protein